MQPPWVPLGVPLGVPLAVPTVRNAPMSGPQPSVIAAPRGVNTALDNRADRYMGAIVDSPYLERSHTAKRLGFELSPKRIDNGRGDSYLCG